MTNYDVSLIEKLEAYKGTPLGGDPATVDGCIAIIRAHTAEQDVVQKLFTSEQVDNLNRYGSISKPMGDASTRKDEGDTGTTVTTSASVESASPVIAGEISDNGNHCLTAFDVWANGAFLGGISPGSKGVALKAWQAAWSQAWSDGYNRGLEVEPNTPVPVSSELDRVIVAVDKELKYLCANGYDWNIPAGRFMSILKSFAKLEKAGEPYGD